jgi:integrase
LAEFKLPKVTLHALRHTHASQIIAAGMDPVAVSRRLGHASVSITLGIYGHLFENSGDRAADIVEAAFGSVMKE